METVIVIGDAKTITVYRSNCEHMICAQYTYNYVHIYALQSRHLLYIYNSEDLGMKRIEQWHNISGI